MDDIGSVEIEITERTPEQQERDRQWAGVVCAMCNSNNIDVYQTPDGLTWVWCHDCAHFTRIKKT